MHRFTYEDGARLLTSELALPDLSLADAISIVPWMRLTLARPDAVLFRAGGPSHQFLVLLLDGDAVVEGQLVGGKEAVVLRTLAAGSLFGELGTLDSITRSVLVRATSDTCLATLDDQALAQIVRDKPDLGCALLRAVLGHVIRRLRSANNKIEALNEINHTLRAEWQAESRFDEQTRARLSVLMKLEQRLGVSSGGLEQGPRAARSA
jgi:CRP-like cAMP-binding protein